MYNPYDEMKNTNFIKYMSDGLCNSYFDSFFEDDDYEIIPKETISEPVISNCLALTIKKDYKLTSIVNVTLRGLRMTFKVLVSYAALIILKLFF